MIIRYVRMTFREEKVETFLALFNETKQQIRNFSGCRYVELQRDIHQPHVFMTHSHWDSETDLNKYRDSELFNFVWSNTKIHFADKPVAFSVDSVEVV